MEKTGLFRAIRKDNFEMIEGYYVPIDNKHHYILTGKLDLTKGYPQFEHFEIIPETLEEYSMKNLSHQLYNLKPKAFYADGNWDLYKEGYNDCINDVIDLFEKAESCNEKSDEKDKSDNFSSKGSSMMLCNTSDIEMINKFEKVALNENDVIIFTFVLADNEIDTNNEQLCSSTLCELSHLFVGVNGTVHLSKSEIKSRIFECYVDIVDGKQTKNGEQYCRLIARAYVKKFLLSDNDIKEISNATFNEATLGAAVSERICGICGNPVGKCNHNDYTKLLNATDAYEWNLFKKEN